MGKAVATVALVLYVSAVSWAGDFWKFSESDSDSLRSVADASQLSIDQLPADVLLDEASGAELDDDALPASLAELMRPTINLGIELLSEATDVELASYRASLQIPTYPMCGPPPPFINASFSFTDLSAPVALDLPSDLYDYSLGLSWMRPIDDCWMLRFMLSGALATDGANNSSDAWQFRGGAFAMYRANDHWTWIIGALALGRSDLPAVPAVGAIWQPSPDLRFDFTLPKPKISFLMFDNGPRQQWGYVGGGFSGGTWAYEQASGVDDQLTYRDWRLMVGWESTPTPEPGMPFTRGRKVGVELGYVFSRDFEFESRRRDISLDDTILLRATASF